MLYRIAERIVQYEPVYPLLRKKMESYRLEEMEEYSEGKNIDIVISLDEEYYKERQKEHSHLTVEECEYIWAGASFYRKLILQGGIMIHASAVIVDDKAYLFSANSGTGKSTHTKQWQKLFGSERAIILNDDKPAVRRTEEGWFAYGTPFSGKTDENVNRKVKLQGICMLERGEDNYIERMDVRTAIPLLINQTILPRYEKATDGLMDILDGLFREVPVYGMRCTISEEAAQMAYDRMSKGEERYED